MSFPAYPSYRNSGVEWLGEVPSHWETVRLSRHVRSAMGQTILRDMLDDEPSEETLPVYSASEGEGIFGHFRNPAVRLKRGDIVVGARGSIGFARRIREPATCTQTTIWISLTSERLNAEYLYWCLVGGREGLFPFDKTAIPMLTVEQVRAGRVPLPTLNEQVAIAAFLDRETVKIDALIKEQRRLIALLKEKRQAVISHAVTKGLDPHAPMKDSGIEWLGEVPAHWKVMALRRLVDPARPITYGIVQPGAPDPQGRFMVRGQDYSRGWVSGEEIFRVSDNIEAPYRRARLQTGDVVITIVGAGIGNTAVVPPFLTGANITQTTARVAPLLKLAGSDYLAILMGSQLGEVQVALYQKGAAQPGLNLEHLAAFRFPIPPRREQIATVERISPALKHMQEFIEAAEQAMALLRERRAALISAAVAGEIDVRPTALMLPFLIDRARARGLVATEIIERSAHQRTFHRVKLQKIAFLAEAHLGISELAGSYLREAAGPLDRQLVDEMERGAHSIARIVTEQVGGTGSVVVYRLAQHPGGHCQELADWLGPERTARLDKLIDGFADLDTKGAEAVATLYAVWNDALIDGMSPSDDEIISGFLNDWHEEKAKKFRAAELPEWLGWMRRHGIVPIGTGPQTTTGRLFA